MTPEQGSRGRSNSGHLIGRPAMARTLAYFCIAGATLMLATLAPPLDTGADPTGMLVVAALAYAVGAALLLFANRLPRGSIHAVLTLATVLTSAAIYIEGRASSVFAVLYLWVAVEAFYLLARRGATVQVALIGAGYAMALILLPEDQSAARWIVTVGAAGVMGALVSYQRRRIHELVESLDDAARTDPLTGLLNRRAFEELFDSELERALRSQSRLAVMIGDLDGFKAVNDRFGHEVGDAALCLVAEDMVKWKRRIDTPARIGGEEFALLLPDTDQRGAFLVAERLRRAAHRSFADQPVELTISFGVSVYPEHGEDLRSLMRSADRALYAAKDLGKDRTAIYSADVARVLARASGSRSGDMHLSPLMALAEALDVRDHGDALHSRTVGRYARMIAVELGLSPERVERVRLAGVLHDIGKIGVSDPLLVKTGPLEDEEWDELRTHPEIGAGLLSRPELSDLREWVLCHHERPDGTGYPHGMQAKSIPLEAKILAVADAYEAMTRDRVYRRALGDVAAEAELRAGAGTQFDSAVVDAFLRALEGERQARLEASVAEGA